LQRPSITRRFFAVVAAASVCAAVVAGQGSSLPASDPLPAGLVEDIQVLRPGQTTWKAFQTSAVGQSAPFTADAGAGKYQFRARLRNPQTGSSTVYSATRSVKFS